MTSIESARVNMDTKLKHVEHLAKDNHDGSIELLPQSLFIGFSGNTKLL